MQDIKRNELIAFAIGVVIGGILTHTYFSSSHSHSHDTVHQITQPEEEYHVHSDFLIYVNDQRIDLNKEEFMTTSQNELHESVHLHDSNGEVVHLHENNVAFAEFLSSIGYGLTNDCLTIDESEYCSNDSEKLGLYVNFKPYASDYTTYVPVDDDSILLYFGVDDPEIITSYMNEVKDDSCYYSGTCPERGIAPPESCGLTCEI